MFVIKSHSSDPYFNLAAEQYLMKERTDEILFIYYNDPSVIVGKNQHALAEINYHYVRDNQMKVARRISGGGAVYHDRGNMNFSIFEESEKGYTLNYERFLKPVIAFLNSLGLKAQISDSNSIVINDRKISGNAQYISGRRVLHHGTFLFSVQTDNLDKALKPALLAYDDKAVISNRKPVVNLCDVLDNNMTVKRFEELFISFFGKNRGKCIDKTLTKEEIRRINRLVETKFATWEWNFGYLPFYELKRNIKIGTGSCSIRLRVEKGVISAVSVKGEENMHILQLKDNLIGVKHEETVLLKAIRPVLIKIKGVSEPEIEALARLLM